MLEIALAVVVTLLVVSVALNVAYHFDRRRFEHAWLARETSALDRAHAAELRSQQQIDAMLDRVSTKSHLDLAKPVMTVDVDPSLRKAWFDDDDPTEHAAWDKVHDSGEAEATP